MVVLGAGAGAVGAGVVLEGEGRDAAASGGEGCGWEGKNGVCEQSGGIVFDTSKASDRSAYQKRSWSGLCLAYG